jgi:DNA-directed RNA polymerase sigma subunit (sigma70/sigma32)
VSRRHGMSQREVAEALGISRAAVQQIENRALRKLKNSGKLDAFRDLVDGTWRDEGKGLEGKNEKLW